MKDIQGYEGIYAITKNGKIWQFSKQWNTGKGFRTFQAGFISLWKNARGYVYVSLRKNTIRKTIGVHRLVAQTYIPNPLNLPQVNHLNGIKTDNRVKNLEWCDAFRNTQHSYEIGTNKSYGENHKKSKLTVKDIEEIIKSPISANKLCKVYGVHRTAITSVRKGRTWRRVTGF